MGVFSFLCLFQQGFTQLGILLDHPFKPGFLVHEVLKRDAGLFGVEVEFLALGFGRIKAEQRPVA